MGGGGVGSLGGAEGRPNLEATSGDGEKLQSSEGKGMTPRPMTGDGIGACSRVTNSGSVENRANTPGEPKKLLLYTGRGPSPYTTPAIDITGEGGEGPDLKLF